MSRCFNCGFYYADCDTNGVPLSLEYCHCEDDIAPCEYDEIELQNWLDEQEYKDIYARYGEPYDHDEDYFV